MYVSDLIEGRPSEQEAKGRLDKEMKVYDLLDQLKIPFHRLDHDKAETIAMCEDIDAKLEATICKNLFLCNAKKTEFHLLMMPGHKRFVTKDISKQVEKSRLTFAASEYMEAFLDITPGSVSVMGLMNDTNHRVNLIIDREIMESEWLGCHPCINTASLRIATKDILEKFLPYTGHPVTVVDIEG